MHGQSTEVNLTKSSYATTPIRPANVVDETDGSTPKSSSPSGSGRPLLPSITSPENASSNLRSQRFPAGSAGAAVFVPKMNPMTNSAPATGQMPLPSPVPRPASSSNPSASPRRLGGSAGRADDTPGFARAGSIGSGPRATSSLRSALASVRSSDGKSPPSFEPSYRHGPPSAPGGAGLGNGGGMGPPNAPHSYQRNPVNFLDPARVGINPIVQHDQSGTSPHPLLISPPSAMMQEVGMTHRANQLPPSQPHPIHQDQAQQQAATFKPFEYMKEFMDSGVLSAQMDDHLTIANTASSVVASHCDDSVAMNRSRHPLQHHLSNAPLPHVSNLHPIHLAQQAFFMEPQQRERLHRKNDAIHASALPPNLGGLKLPEELHVYHSLVPLEPSVQISTPAGGLPAQLIDPRITPSSAPGMSSHLSGGCGEPSRIFGYRSHVYKAICTLDGKSYALRRLEGFRLSHQASIGLVERWRKIRHPAIVSVREAFTTRAFGDFSIVFVFDYHPLATTLYAEHMVPKLPQTDRRTGRLQTVSMAVPERTLWSYACQLASVLRCIHSQGLAARCIEPSKVLRTGRNRIRINCCSVFDVIAYESDADRLAYQQEDISNLGKLLIAVACNSSSVIQDLQASMEHVSKHYSQELTNLFVWLLDQGSGSGRSESPSNGGGPVESQEPGDSAFNTIPKVATSSKTAEALVCWLAPRMADEADAAHNFSDLLESNLMRELENARLVRLLMKINLCLDRPAFRHDPKWAETGERYPILLFRDMVFHAQDESGAAIVDLSHMLAHLNRLDAGSDEQIQLVSRDEQSVLVTSYREIKHCLESSFHELSTS